MNTITKDVTIKQIFDSFMETERIMMASYKSEYDEVIMSDIIYSFKNEFFKELEYYIKDSDWLDLVEEFDAYQYGKENA